MNYKEKLKNIDTFIFDIDGVLTDGIVILTDSGEQVRKMNVKDGFAIRHALSKGYRIAIISGGESEGLKKRFEYLGVTDIYLGCENKKNALSKLTDIHKLNLQNITYMGDDLNDLDIMKEVGLPTCPQDAATEIKEMAEYISNKNGGKGCVRDIIEQTLRTQEKW